MSNEPPVRAEFIIDDAVFAIDQAKITPNMVFEIKVRYQARPERGRVELISGKKGVIYLENPVKSVAPGQSAVIYDGDAVIGGGFISFR